MPPTPRTFLTRYRLSRRWPSESGSPGFMQHHRSPAMTLRTGPAGAPLPMPGSVSRDRIYRKFQKRLANNDFVTGLELYGTAGLQAGPPVHVSAVQTANVLNGDLAFRDSDQCVFA